MTATENDILEPQEDDWPGKVSRLAAKAAKTFSGGTLPPDLSPEDLSQMAAEEILEQAQRAWKAGKVTSAEILVKAARRRIGKELTRAGKRDDWAIGGGGGVEGLEGREPREEAPQKGLLSEVLETLEDQEREAIELRYGLRGRAPLTWTQMAQALDLTVDQARGLVDRALSKMSQGKGPEE